MNRAQRRRANPQDAARMVQATGQAGQAMLDACRAARLQGPEMEPLLLLLRWP